LNLIPLEDNFKKVLCHLDMEDIEEILNEFEFPKSKKKDDLIEIILKNATVFEYAVDYLFRESNISEIRILCDDLDIDSKKNLRSELEKKILHKLNKNIENRNIENKINFLSSPSAFRMDELQNILADHGMYSTGKKEKLVEKVARNDFLVIRSIIEWKKELQKEDIKKMCKSLDIDSEGNRKNLLQRINDYVFKNEVKRDIQNELTMTNSNSTKSVIKISEKDLENNFKRFSWEDAEDLTALLFNTKGYSAEVGVPTKDTWKRKRNGDHGIDVRAEIDKVTTGIQVKHWESNVDEDSVIKTNGSSQIFNRVIIISTKKGFEKNALDWAEQPGNAERMDLWDCDKFKKELRRYLIKN
jgi:hypothetical protein